MAYKVLYRTYRPARFSDVVGQEYIVKTLQNAIRNKKIAHAYLFCGPRGTGKTSIAKLFAKAINCENYNGESCDDCPSCNALKENNHPDIIELDAASNNRVENVREIIDQVPFAPILGKYKVYIIDEVHMLTTSAFNALLKTLEEPPTHVVFILATTDPQKVIPTVLSRCQRYNFSKLTNFEIRKKLSEVLQKENIPFEDAAVEEIATLAEGGMRDALSILEQVLSYNDEKVTLEDVQKIFGISTNAEKCSLLLHAHQHHVSEVISKLREMYQNGVDMKRLALDLLEIIKETIIFSDQGDARLLSKITKIDAQNIMNDVNVDILLEDAQYLEEAINREKQNQNFLSYLELAFIKIAKVTKKTDMIPATRQEENRAQVSYEKKEEPEERPVIEDTKPSLDYLLSILLMASREEKINDAVIYNKLELYRYDPEKRKYHQALSQTELFASCHDAIIVLGNDIKVNGINARDMNEDLYNFFNNEFGIDKMIYAINENDKQQLISMYKSLAPEKRRAKVEVVKYQQKEEIKELTTPDKLKALFGQVKVEE